MKTRSSALSLIMLALSLTGCSAKANPEKLIVRNGDLFANNAISFDNALVDISFTQLEAIMKSEEKIVFYLQRHECQGCQDFKPIITSYVQKTEALVYTMYVDDKSGDNYTQDILDLEDKYGEYFFIDGKVLTPQVYIVQGEKVAEQVPYSRYAQKFMFKKAMKEYVEPSNFYAMHSVKAYKGFIEAKYSSKFATLIVDSENLSDYKLFSENYSKFKESKINLACLYVNDENRDEVKSSLGIEDTSFITASYSKKGKEEKFDLKTSDDIDGFIKSYL